MKAAAIRILVAGALLASTVVHAACVDWQMMPFGSLSGPNGTGGFIQAVTLWDPDGIGGPLGPMLVAAGEFTEMQGVPASNIAARDPVTGQWQALGAGTNDRVQALAVYNGELIAGGFFTSAGGVTVNHIARWNGSSWQSLGPGTDNRVEGLTVYNGELIAAGYFLSAGETVASHVARWDGSTWQALGNGTNAWVLCLAVYNGELIAGGFFTGAGLVGANHIARWNGSSWLALGSGTNDDVVCVSVAPGGLAVGGRFTTAGGLAANRVALWDGTWHALGTGMNNIVISLMSYQNQLIAGGAFTTAGGASISGVAKWTGSSWQSLDSGVIGSVFAMVPWGNYLAVGGSFNDAGFHLVNNLGTWDGYEWGSFGGGGATSVNAMATYGNRVVAGGDFQQSGTLDLSGHYLIGWNGTDLVPFGTGMDSPVYGLLSFTYTIGGVRELVAGGTFLHAGGVATNRIARWQEGIFVPSGWQAMGAGFNAIVYAIERHNNATYAGGGFTASSVALNRIARWNENTSAWEAMGTGMNSTVLALKSYNGYLYAGGSFTTAGGVSTGGLARWDGSAWSAVGGVFNGTVYALEVHNGELVIGGAFNGPGASSDLARWNGTSLSNFGIGGANNTVHSLKSTGTRLYIGGDFTSINGNTCRHIAYWDGGVSIFEANGGANNNVYGMTYSHHELHAAGAFSTVKNDVIESRCWAKYLETGIPWITKQPTSQTVADGGNATFTATPASGYNASHQWYQNDLPLTDGPTGTGSTISGAHAATLTISNTSNYDTGNYRMSVSNACGAETSSVAQLNPGRVDASPAGTLTTRFALGQNPAQGPAPLTFSLARESEVRFTIHDVAGRRVRDLEIGRLPAGSYTRAWDACDRAGQRVGAGLYFVSFDVDGRRVGVRRITMLR